MASRVPIWIALAANCIVAVTTYAVRGWNAEAAHVAARNTARFSMLWFVVGFAAPSLIRWIRGLPSEARLIQAFVAAHLVHFVSVAVLLATFESAHVSSHPAQVVAVALFGSALVVGLGLTATPRASRAYTVTHKILLYTVSLIFFLAFVHHPFKPLRLLAVALGVALIVRVTNFVVLRQARTKATA